MAEPGKSSIVKHYETVEENTEACSRICQFVLFLVVSAALATGLMSTLSCEFIIYVLPPIPPNQTSANNTLNLAVPIPGNISKASFGVYRYKEDINSNVCYWYNFPDRADKPGELRVAEWASSLAAAFAGLAVIFLFTEFCCCRFPCSRVLTHLFFLLGACSVVPTFALYSHPNCNLFSSNAFACDLGSGSYFAMACCGLLLLSLCFSFMTPKTKPIVRYVQEREKTSEQDPCICGFCASAFSCCCTKKSKEDIYKENPELLLAELPSEDVQVGDSIFKHYYDDKGGVTLQSQYVAASDHWLACERNYQTMLDVFKQECQDVQTNSRGFSNKKSDDAFDDENINQNEKSYGASSEIQQNADWKYLVSIPPESIEDPELSRLACVLSVMRRNCQQAKTIMDRIEGDLDDHIKSPEEKLNAALSEIKSKEQESDEKKPPSGPDIEAQTSGSVHGAPSETEKHANVATTNMDETRSQNGVDEDDRNSSVVEPLLPSTSVVSNDKNDDGIEAHVSATAGQESDVLASAVAPTDDNMFDGDHVSDSEPPSDKKNPHGWTPLKTIWGGSDNSEKKTS